MYTRATPLRLTALVAAFVAVACVDDASRTAGPRGPSLEGATLTGRAVLTVELYGRTGLPGVPTSSVTDTADFVAVVENGSAEASLRRRAAIGAQGIRPLAYMLPSDGSDEPSDTAAGGGPEDLYVPLVYTAAAAAAQQGTRQHSGVTADGATAQVITTARNGAPYSEERVLVNGELRWKVTDTWRYRNDSYVLTHQYIELHDAGVLIGTFTVDILSETVTTTLASAHAQPTPAPARADALAHIGNRLLAMIGPRVAHAQNSGPCADQMDKLDDAMDEYVASVVLAGVATLSGNLPAAIAADVNAVRSIRKLRRAMDALDRCTDQH